ncbi:hypothetical protein CFO_g2785 [Ceratocystis platani]|uniref:Extracellular serine-rich protein n=1 Tax=Ceratocystis fimbriata f. sp. platani TaxID=88771 RepID=A0A0F8B3Y6_CERFI|nr:hypothetical protein CFO_g2785 [Ceratocystis platani]
MQLRFALIATLVSAVLASPAPSSEGGSSSSSSSSSSSESSSSSSSSGSTSGSGSSSSSSSGTETFAVRVGMDATGKTVLKFSPDTITAPVGSVVQFQFMGGNHTVTQSSFDGPCVPISETSSAVGFHSGFVPAAASVAKGEIPVYSITINDTKPLWVYCAQGKHCQSGMSMVINENTASNSSRSLANYRTAAVNVAVAKAPVEGSTSGGTAGLAPAPSSGLGSGSASGTGALSSGTPIATAAASKIGTNVVVPGFLAYLAMLL